MEACIDENGNRVLRMNADAVDVAKAGLERYTTRRDDETSRVSDAILEYTRKVVEAGRMDADVARDILERNGMDVGGKFSLREGESIDHEPLTIERKPLTIDNEPLTIEGEGDGEEQRGKDVRFSLGDSPETFKERQKQAVDKKGVVMPGLRNKSVKIVSLDKHPYPGRWSDAKKAAIKDAVDKYTKIVKGEKGEDKRVPIPQLYNNYGKSFFYNISTDSIKESVNPKQVDKSLEQGTPQGVHLAILNRLNDVIGESIEIEEHPDYNKGEDGIHRPENGFNDGILVHRFIGAIRVDGKDYTVKTTMLEYKQQSKPPRQYAYDVTKIEVSDESPNTSNGLTGADKGLKPLANLLKDVEKSYDPGVKLLDVSEESDNYSDIRDNQRRSLREDRDYLDAVEKGDEEKAREMVKKAFDEYLKGHSYSRGDVARVFGDMLEKNRDGYDVFGIRFDNRLLVPNEVFPHSHELFQDYMEDENGESMYPEGEGPYSGFYDAGELDGTSTVWVENAEDIAKALGERYDGRYVYLVGGDNRGGGNDPGELLIDNAKVLSVMTIPEMELGRWKDNTTYHEVFTNKSQEVVSRDDAGEVVPLSERFDEGKKDIRWSLPEKDERGNDVRPSTPEGKENKGNRHGFLHDELIYTAENITPEQQALLDGNNPHQYSSEREQYSSKDNTFFGMTKLIGEKMFRMLITPPEHGEQAVQERKRMNEETRKS
ncbi:MAG: hypothetical protein IKH26_04910 [Bacteroidaceae bacterium]|nr:hypothetical protein [Bacteroidaceae bacterium]